MESCFVCCFKYHIVSLHILKVLVDNIRVRMFIYSRFHFLFFVCDQDVEVEKQSHFAIVNMKTATTAAVSGFWFTLR